MKNLAVLTLLLIVALAACSPSAPANPIEISQATVVIPGGTSAGGDAMGGDTMGGDGMDGDTMEEDAMGNNSMGSMDMGVSLAGYMQIKNNSTQTDRLLAVSSDFAYTMLHETIMEGDVMKMNPISGIDIPAGSTLELKTGSYHIMFMNPNKELKVGDTVNLTLKFEKAGDVTIPAIVESR